MTLSHKDNVIDIHCFCGIILPLISIIHDNVFTIYGQYRDVSQSGKYYCQSLTLVIYTLVRATDSIVTTVKCVTG